MISNHGSRHPEDDVQWELVEGNVVEVVREQLTNSNNGRRQTVTKEVENVLLRCFTMRASVVISIARIDFIRL